MRTKAPLALGVLALALAGCGKPEKTEVVAEQSDMVVETPGPSDAPVNLPTTPMTPAAETAPASGEAPAT